MKKVSIIGSTGSIGKQTLDIASAHKDELSIVALAAGGRSLQELANQVVEFAPELVSVPTQENVKELRELLGSFKSDLKDNTKSHSEPDSKQEQRRSFDPKTVEILHGAEGLEQVATISSADTLVTGVVGFLGVGPTLAAIKKGKKIALANKETLVAAGAVIMPALKEHGASIVPVDSEHSAIFQSMVGHTTDDLECIWLTGSGGPFRTWTIDQIKSATKDDALKHPNWSMGPKITIDSATMMNKGLEIIEARWLFNLEPARINVLVHPQSILHSAVQFVDGSIVGQLGVPDMRLPIHYAIFHPERVGSQRVPRLDLVEIAKLTFEAPDYEKFPCLKIAKEVAASEGTMACVLNAANEVVVEAFLAGGLKFHTISDHINKVLDRHNEITKPSLEDILEADRWARHEAASLLKAESIV